MGTDSLHLPKIVDGVGVTTLRVVLAVAVGRPAEGVGAAKAALVETGVVLSD